MDEILPYVVRAFEEENSVASNPESLPLDEHTEVAPHNEKRLRLEAIKASIQPRLEETDERVDRFNRLGVTRNSTRLMIVLGWISVTTLGWVFTWLLDRSLRSMDTDLHATDILTLFLRSFRTLGDRLGRAAPYFPDWVMLALGIVLIIVSVLTYLNAQRLAGRFRSIENMIAMLAGTGVGGPRNMKVTPSRHRGTELKAQRRSVVWLMAAGVSGVLGIGMTLGAIDGEYHLSVVLLGYGLAAAAVLSAFFWVAHNQAGKDGVSNSPATGTPISTKPLLRWLFVAIGAFAIAVLICAFEPARVIGEMMCVLSVGCFLGLAILGLAVAEVQNNAFLERDYLMRLRIQLERRILGQANNVFKTLRRRARRIESAREKARDVRRRTNQLWIEFEAAYEIGRVARELTSNGDGSPTLSGP